MPTDPEVRVPCCPSVRHRTWLRGLAQGASGGRLGTILITSHTNQPVARTHACHISYFTWRKKAIMVHLVSLKTGVDPSEHLILPDPTPPPPGCDAAFQSIKHSHVTMGVDGLPGAPRCLLSGAGYLWPLYKAPGGGTIHRSGPGQGLVLPAPRASSCFSAPSPES